MSPIKGNISPVKEIVPKILIIGGGWYGCHVAAEIKLHAKDIEVFIFEKNSEIFSEISGNFGIRLHAGPHYPRSSATRLHCQNGFSEFLLRYPELVNHHSYSDYGLGTIDANGQPSKVTKHEFIKVFKEFGNSEEVSSNQRKYECVEFVGNIEEPSVVQGHRLRQFFQNYLKKLKVHIHCNFHVESIQKSSNGVRSLVTIKNQINQYEFEHVINATSFQAFLPGHSLGILTPLPLKATLVYQTCIILTYEYVTQPIPEKPFSFIIMDGFFPCIMPLDDRVNCTENIKKYIFIHGKWTILGSFRTVEEAKTLETNLNDEFIEKHIRRQCESDITRFWPEFTQHFKYTGWLGTVLAKLKTDTEFRSAVTFCSQLDNMIYVFPGKINNIFDTGREVLILLGLKNGRILQDGQFSYVEDGVLNLSEKEITKEPQNESQNTCNLQTYQELNSQ